MQIFKMAFRNIFRNEKRSIFTIFAFIIAISGVMFGLSYIGGMQEMLMREGMNISGHVRITVADFDIKERQLDTSANIPYEEIRDRIELDDRVKDVVARLKFGSLVFKDDEDEQALGFGIEEKDYGILRFEEYMIDGRFLDFNNNSEIIVGEKIAEKLNLKLDDEITLLTSTQYGSVSAFNYKVVGMYKMDNSRLNQSFYIKLKDAEYLLDMDSYSTELLIFLNDYTKVSRIIEKVRKNLEGFRVEGKELAIKSWDKIGLNEYMTKAFPIIKFYFMLIFGILAGVGISNTMMMIVFERRKEIGVLRAMGMEELKIKELLLFEGLILGLFGAGLGALTGGGIGYYYSKHGIYLGEVLEVISGEYNLGTTIYPVMNLNIMLKGILLGVIVSLLSTYIAILPELKKKAVENLRND